MNEAVAVGSLIGVAIAVIGLILKVKQQVGEQRDREATAIEKTRKKHIREGYLQRNAEVVVLIDRVSDLLSTCIEAAPELVDRSIKRVLTILDDSREGNPPDVDVD